LILLNSAVIDVTIRMINNHTICAYA